jgi:site-specific DNA-methyltransferase (adenine-specific)/modification methylase
VRKEVIGNATLYCGDSREILPSLSADVVVTDPPWDQAKCIPGADDPRGLFADVSPFLATYRLAAVQLGCYTDPCFLAPLASRMKYLHTCWLRYIPPSYNGRVLVDADVAYVYGKPPASRPGARVLPSQCQSTSREPSEREFLRRHGKNRTSAAAAETIAAMSHPMPRCLAHVRWLVRWHSEESDTVLDPFLGSGTTGVAALVEGRRFIGIEVHEPFFDLACGRVEEAQRQERLFAQVP